MGLVIISNYANSCNTRTDDGKLENKAPTFNFIEAKTTWRIPATYFHYESYTSTKLSSNDLQSNIDKYNRATDAV